MSDQSGLRLLHVLQTPRAEGTPNLVLDWLNAGRGHLWQGVLVLNREPDDLSDRLRAAADDYEEHGLFRHRWSKYPTMSAVVRLATRRIRPDAIICWTTGYGNWVCLGAAAAGCRRLIVHAGNPPVRGLKGDWVSRYGMWPLATVGAKVVCCSRYVRDMYRSIPATGIREFYAIHNCARGSEVEVRSAVARSAAGAHPPTAIMVATLELHKDHETLLQAVPAVAARLPGFRLRLVGDGSCREQIVRTIARLGISDSVELLGSRRDVPELLGAADLFVLSTTLQEGLGSVLIEALAAGLPVVATDVPACRELLEDGRWGTLVTPRDPDSLAAAMSDLLAAPVDPAVTRPGIDFAAGLTPTRMMRDYLALVGLQPPF